MSRPKAEVNEVWVLEEIWPYDGSEILGVFVNPEVAMSGRDDKGPWQKARPPERPVPPLEHPGREVGQGVLPAHRASVRSK